MHHIVARIHVARSIPYVNGQVLMTADTQPA